MDIDLKMQIEEPIKIKEKDESLTQAVSIGIDLGTTNCVASFVEDGKISTIEFDSNGDILPSVVAISRNFDVLVGKDAFRKRFDENFCFISSSKRKIGSSNELFSVFGKKYSPTQIAALILMKIKESAEKQLGKKIDDCVITVPAKFDDNQRNETKIAGKMAGFNVKKVINEPTAAALAYGLDNASEGVYVVYDLGGGTFDVSVLSMKMGVFRVIATDGDVEIGGDDIDDLFSQFIATKYNIENKKELLIISKNIKEYLSNNDFFSSKIDIAGEIFEVNLSRSDLEGCAFAFVEKTIDSMIFAIKESRKEKIDGVILVGGMTKMPLITQKISEVVDCKIYTNLDPDKIVGIGAGIKAAGKRSGFENVLLDICPLSLGVETMGGVVEKIIYRNTPIPCAAIQNFTTSIDNQTGIVLNIVQGERELAADCRNLGKILLKNLSLKAAGMVKIEVRFEIDVDGILSVTALDLDTKNYITTEIKPTYGLSYESMSDMLISSIENSKNDMLNRLLAESKEAAKASIFAIEKAILEDGDLISREYLEKIETKITELEALICRSDRDLIEKGNSELDKISEKFVEERTNKYLKSVISGKSINDDIS